MQKEKTLQEVKEEISGLMGEQEKYEYELRQLRNQEKKLKKMANIEERKKRNHRLVVRGLILESFIKGAEEMSDEVIKEIVKKAFQKNDDENLLDEKQLIKKL